MKLSADTRYSFVSQFLEAAEIFAQRAKEIELTAGDVTPEPNRVIHRGYVVSVIFQSVAALEAQIHEVIAHGPGAHLGSNRTDKKALEFLRPLETMIDNQKGVLSRYQTVLHLLGKSQFPTSREPYQGAYALMRLRNELVHYKSRWGSEMHGEKWQRELHKKFANLKPPFVPAHSNFFPYICLSAACANWAVSTARKFLIEFYHRLEVESPSGLGRTPVMS